MPTARHHHTSAIVDGKLFIIGGRETDVPSNVDNNEMYDPVHDRWIIHTPMPTKRSGLAAATIGLDIFAVGGEKIEGSFDTNEKYDTLTDSWTPETPMPTNRLGHDAVELNDKIYVFGGKTGQETESITDVNEILSRQELRAN
jgi:N-acetylneuraminic acid mutarotase